MQANPAVAFNGTNYIVTWNDRRFAINRIVASRVTPAGAVLDTGNVIGAVGVDEQCPDIEYDGSRCLAVWGRYTAPFGVDGRFVNAQALPVDTVMRIANTATYKYMNPKLATSGSRYLVVWNDMNMLTYDYSVYGQLMSAQGQLIGSQITIAEEDSPEKTPQVIYDGSKFLVAWDDSGVIKGRFIDTLGQLMGMSFNISATSSWMRSFPWISASTTNYLVAWEEARATKDIYANLDMAIGIHEFEFDRKPLSESNTTTYCNSLKDYSEGCDIYNIAGMPIDPLHAGSGIYFVKHEQTGSIKKIILIK